jgi:hypothetical protein
LALPHHRRMQDRHSDQHKLHSLHTLFSARYSYFLKVLRFDPHTVAVERSSIRPSLVFLQAHHQYRSRSLLHIAD